MQKRKNQPFLYAKIHPIVRWAVLARRQSRPRDFSLLPKFLTISQTAKLVRVHPNTLRAWDAAGKLRAVRFGPRHDRRYLRDEILAFVVQTPGGRRFLNRRIQPASWRRATVAVGAAMVIFGLGATWPSERALADSAKTTTVAVSPTTCSGWTNPTVATSIDLPSGADSDRFTSNNSAQLTGADLGISSTAGVVTPTFDQPAPALDCSGFSVSANQLGTLSAARLRVSLMASGRDNSTEVIRLSTSLDGQTWMPLTAVPVLRADREYLTLDLPEVTDRELLRQLRIRVEADVEPGGAAIARLDGLAAVLAFTPTAAPTPSGNDSPRQKELDRLAEFSQAAYDATDQPTILIPKKQSKRQFLFSKKTEEWKLTAAVLVDTEGQAKKIEYRTVDETKGDNVSSRLRLRMEKQHPGKYQLRVTMVSPNGTLVTIDEPFLWGVLAVNLRRANPSVGQTQEVTIGVLDDTGRTICKATVRATVTDPKGKRTNFQTKNSSIITNPDCVDKGVTNEADYHFKIKLEQAGVYHVDVEADTAVGKRTSQENFSVEPRRRFDVERADYPTRIYPVVDYPVRIAVTPKADYLGLVTERVPADFEVSEVFPAGSVRRAVDNVNQQIIEWLVQWKVGQTYYLTYTFDAPDVSPALFLTGPLTVGGSFIAEPDFQESREWQIASDAVAAPARVRLTKDAVTKDQSPRPVQAVDLQDGDFTPQRDRLAEPTKPVFRDDEQAVVKIYKQGFDISAGKKPKELNPDQPTQVTDVEVLGPWKEAEPLGATVVTEDVARSGQTVEVAHLVQNENFHPGVYTIRTTYSDGVKTSIEDTEFAWGVLVVNPEKSIYLPGETAKFGMAVLDWDGSTLCQADLKLTVTAPSGAVTVFDTVDGTVVRSYDCDVHSVTNTPDYSAAMPVTEVGTYQLTLESTIKEGQAKTYKDEVRSVTDSFEVRESVPFDVSRADTPTRLYPIANYTAHITVTANQAYQGTIEEYTPVSFVLSDISDGGQTFTTPDGRQGIRWTANFVAGDVHTYAYTFDPPDPSPRVYPLGPVVIGTFQETRAWQLAADATKTWDGGGSGGGAANWSTIANWDLDAQPVADDAIVFNGTSNDASTWDASATIGRATSITISSYSGALIITKTPISVTAGFSHTSTGNVTYTGSLALTVAGAYTLTTSGTLTPNTSTLILNGSAANINTTKTHYAITLGAGAVKSIVTNSFSYSNLLTIGASSASLTISSGLTLTSTATSGAALVMTGGILNGPGTLTYRSSTTFPIDGTLGSTSIIRFDMVTNAMTMPAWTGYGNVEAYSNSTTAKIFTLGTAGSQTITTAGYFYVMADSSGAGDDLTVQGATWDPTFNVGGDFNFTGIGTTNEIVTAPDAAATWTVSGNFDITDGTWTTSAETVKMNGTTKNLIAAGQTIKNVQISGSISISTSNLTVSGLLTVDTTKSLTVNSGLTITLSANTGTSLSLSGTLNGPGTLIYQNSATTFPTTGTLAAVLILRFDTVNGNLNVPARTDYGEIHVHGASANPRTVTLGTTTSQTITTSSHFTVMAEAASPNDVTLQGATWDPTLNVGGDFDFTGIGTASEIVIAPDAAATWTVSGNVDLTGGTWTPGTETLKMNGTSKTLTPASQSINNFEVSAGTVSASGATTFNGNVVLSGGSFTAPAAAFTVKGNWTNSGGTFVEGTGTVTLNGTASTTLNSGCSTPLTTCTSQNFYNLTLNKTDAADANDNVTLTTNGIEVSNTLTITDGELVQGTLDVRVGGATAVSIALAGKWTNISTGDLKLGGTFTTAGIAVFNSNNGTQCTDGTDDIAITSTVGATQHLWTNTGTLTIYNVNVTDMTDASITAYTSTRTNTTWTAGACASTITVSGTVYQTSSETTVFNCDTGTGGVNLALRVSVNGAAATTGTCSAVGGTFTITGVTDPGAAAIPISVYTDNTANPSQQVTTVTLSSAAATNITGLTLMLDRLVATHENAGPMTNTALDTANNNGDAGIRYGVTAGALTVNAGLELHVLAGKTYTPGGTVTTTATGTTAGPAGDVHIPATAVMDMSTNALSVGGDLTNAGTMTLAATQVTTMTATGAGFTITSGGSTIRTLTFNGASGGWTNSGALTVAEVWTGTAGGFTQANSTTITANGTAFSLASGFTWTKATTGANLILENATNLDFTDSNVTKQDLGAVQIGASPGVTTLKTDMSATTVTIPTGDTFNTKGYDVTASGAFACNGTCALNLTDTAPNNEGDGTILDVGGDFTMSATGTLTAATGKLFMNSTAGANANRTWTTGGKTYNDVELKNAGTTNDQVILSGNLDVNGVFTLTDGTIKADTNNPTTNTAGNISIASTAAYTKGTGAWTFDGTTGPSTYTDANGTAQNIGVVVFNKTSGVGGTDKVTLASSMTVDTADIQTGDTLDLASSGYTLKIAGTGTAATVLTVTGTLTPGTNSTVQYAATNSGGNVNVVTTTYNNLDVSPTGAETYVLTGNLTGGNALTGGLTIGANATLDVVTVSNYGLTLAGTWTNNGVFTAQSGTVTMTGTANLTGSSATTFYNLTVDGSGNTVTVATSDPVVNNTLTIGGAADVNNDTLSIGASRSVTLAANATSNLNLIGSGIDTVSGAGTLVVAGSIAAPINAIGTLSVTLVRFDVSTNAVNMPARAYGGAVQIYNTSATGRSVVMTAGTPTVGSNLTVDTTGIGGATLDGATNSASATITGDVTMSKSSTGVPAITTGTTANTWTISGAVNFTNGTFTAGTGNTLVMNGASKTLTTNAQGLNNLTFNGTVATTLADAVSAAGDVILNNTIAAGSLTMTGSAKNLTGGTATLTNLTISDSTTLITSNLTVATALAVADTKTFTLTGLTVTLSGNSGTTLNLNSTGTVTGGTIIFRNSAGTTLTTSGTISSAFTFDTVNGNQIVPARTFGGAVVVQNGSGAARTLTLGTGASQTLTFSSSLDFQSTAATSTLLIDGDASGTRNPVMNITGAVTTSVATSAVTISMGSGTWTVGGNFDLTNVTTFNHNSGTLTMNGSSKTLTSNTKTLNNVNLSGTITLANAVHTVAGNFVMTGGTITAGTSTVYMTGTANLTFGTGALYNLTVDGSGTTTVTLTNAGTVDNILRIGADTDGNNDTFALGAQILTSGPSGTVTIPGSGIDTCTGSNQLKVQHSNFPTTGTVSCRINFDATNGNITAPARTYDGLVYFENSSNTLDRIITLGTAGGQTFDFNSTVVLRAQGLNNLLVEANTWDPTIDGSGSLGINATGTGGGEETLSMGSGVWTNGGLFQVTAPGENITNTAGGTLDQIGANKNFDIGTNTLNNLTFTGTPALISGAILTGNLVLNASTADSSKTFTTTGTANTITGNGASIFNLTIDPASAGTITAPSTDLTVSGTLTVAAGDTLSLSSGVTYSATLTTTLNGTISGAGTLRFTDASTGPGAVGGSALSSIVRYDASVASIASTTFDARTYGGKVELFSTSATAKTVSCADASTYTISGATSHLYLLANGTGNISLLCDTATDPTVTIGGDLDFTGTDVTGAEAITSGSGTWTIGGNVDFTGGTYTATSGNTLTLNGAAQQTLTTVSQALHHLTVTNASGTDPVSSPSVIFADGWTANGTFTAATANTKLRFLAGGTYAPVAINLNGQVYGTPVYLRSSTPGTTFAFNAGAGTRTVSSTAVKDSNACGSSGGSIDATDGTNRDETNNSCWNINSISMVISDVAIGFGTCAPGAAQYATGTSGSGSDTIDAHTITLSTSAHTGYALTVFGSTLTASVGTITGLGGTAVASSAGTEQFGLRAIKNSGAGTITSPYDTANWAFGASASPQQVAGHSANASTTEIGLRYICNVSVTTEAGAYSTDLTYVLTGTF